MIDGFIRSDNKGGESVAPLYKYDTSDAWGRTLNFDPALYARFCEAAGLTPSTDLGEGDGFRRATGPDRPAEVQVFDYIYGVLHSPDYRARYAEFLKIDFPRVPLPPSPAVFAHVSAHGEQLRRLHLMEPAAIGDAPFPFTGDGDDVVAKGYPKWVEDAEGGAKGGTPHPARAEPVEARSSKGRSLSPRPSTGSGRAEEGSARTGEGSSPTGRVLINPTQGFDGVPPVAWSFHIGGYQPAQKWLKDRRGRTLSWDDVSHYQNVVKVLLETDRLMRRIVLPLDEPDRVET